MGGVAEDMGQGLASCGPQDQSSPLPVLVWPSRAKVAFTFFNGWKKLWKFVFFLLWTYPHNILILLVGLLNLKYYLSSYSKSLRTSEVGLYLPEVKKERSSISFILGAFSVVFIFFLIFFQFSVTDIPEWVLCRHWRKMEVDQASVLLGPWTLWHFLFQRKRVCSGRKRKYFRETILQWAEWTHLRVSGF